MFSGVPMEAVLSILSILASVAFAHRSRSESEAKAQKTHGEAVAALIVRAENAEKARDEYHGKWLASEDRARALRSELSEHENGRSAARMPTPRTPYR